MSFAAKKEASHFLKRNFLDFNLKSLDISGKKVDNIFYDLSFFLILFFNI